jgi:hypothetical protein
VDKAGISLSNKRKLLFVHFTQISFSRLISLMTGGLVHGIIDRL